MFKGFKPALEESTNSIEKKILGYKRGINVISKGSSRRLSKRDSLVSMELIKRYISNFSQPK